MKGSVKTWARMGAEVVMTLFAPGSGAGNLNEIASAASSVSDDY